MGLRDSGAVPLWTVVTVTFFLVLFSQGGFEHEGSHYLIFGAGLSVLLALRVDDRAAVRSLRLVPVLLLVLMALLQIASEFWSILASGESLSAGMVTLAAVAFAPAGAALASRLGIGAVCLIISLVAIASGAVGIVSVGLELHPTSQFLDGNWRPGGPFEYPNALALVQTVALLPLARGISRAGNHAGSGRVVKVLALAWLGQAVVLIAISASVFAQLAACLILLLALWKPELSVGMDRPRAIRILPGLLCAIVVSLLAMGSFPGVGGVDQGGARVMLLVIAALSLPAGWLATGTFRPVGPAAALRIYFLAAILAVAMVGFRLLDAPDDGFLHGRGELASAAIDAAMDRTVAGTGADSFSAASFEQQQELTSRTLFAHNLVLEYWVEVGIAGLLLTIAMIASVVVACWRGRTVPEAVVLAPGALAIVLSALVDWPWHMSSVVMLLGLMLGAMSVYLPEKPQVSARKSELGHLPGPISVP